MFFGFPNVTGSHLGLTSRPFCFFGFPNVTGSHLGPGPHSRVRHFVFWVPKCNGQPSWFPNVTGSHLGPGPHSSVGHFVFFGFPYVTGSHLDQLLLQKLSDQGGNRTRNLSVRERGPSPLDYRCRLGRGDLVYYLTAFPTAPRRHADVQSLDIFCLNAEIPVPRRPIRKPRIFFGVCTHLIFIFLSLIFSVYLLCI